MKQIIKECRDFLDGECADYGMLEDIIVKHFEQKKWLGDSLELTKENNWRRTFEIPATLSSILELKNLFDYISSITGGKFIPTEDLKFTDGKKNYYSVTTVIKENFEKLLLGCGMMLLDYNLGCGRKTFMEYYAASLQKGKEKAEAGLLCRIGELAKRGTLITLTINPFDFLTASDDDGRKKYCAYTSCVRFHGEMFNTILDYLASDNVVMSFTSYSDKPLYKLGRMINYVSPVRIAQTRSFGSYSNFERDLILLYILDKIGGDFQKDYEPARARDFQLERTPYIDYQGAVYTKHGNKREQLHIDSGCCLGCGKKLEIGNNKLGLCHHCKESMKPCIYCGAYRLENNMTTVNGKQYCNNCLERVQWTNCKECGSVMEQGRWCIKCKDTPIPKKQIKPSYPWLGGGIA